MFVKMVSLSLSLSFPPAVFYAWSWSSSLFKRRSAAAATRGGEGGEEREWNVEDFSTECIEKEAPWVEEPSPPKKKRTRESGEGRKGGRKRTHSLQASYSSVSSSSPSSRDASLIPEARSKQP